MLTLLSAPGNARGEREHIALNHSVLASAAQPPIIDIERIGCKKSGSLIA